jgi:hypothetical protein
MKTTQRSYFLNAFILLRTKLSLIFIYLSSLFLILFDDDNNKVALFNFGFKQTFPKRNYLSWDKCMCVFLCLRLSVSVCVCVCEGVKESWYSKGKVCERVNG